jgi:hypothetical protein
MTDSRLGVIVEIWVPEERGKAVANNEVGLRVGNYLFGAARTILILR